MRVEGMDTHTRAKALSIVLMTESPFSNQHHTFDCSIEPTCRQALSSGQNDTRSALRAWLGCEWKCIVRDVSLAKDSTAPGETLAEGRRFELLVPCGTAVFKTAAFGRSATPPRCRKDRCKPGRAQGRGVGARARCYTSPS